MPGDLFRWRQELLRVSTCMYIPGPCGHHSQQETGAGKGRHTVSWSPAATAQAGASSPGQGAWLTRQQGPHGLGNRWASDDRHLPGAAYHLMP